MYLVAHLLNPVPFAQNAVTAPSAQTAANSAKVIAKGGNHVIKHQGSALKAAKLDGEILPVTIVSIL